MTGDFVIDSPQKLKHKLEMVIFSSSLFVIVLFNTGSYPFFLYCVCFAFVCVRNSINLIEGWSTWWNWGGNKIVGGWYRDAGILGIVEEV